MSSAPEPAASPPNAPEIAATPQIEADEGVIDDNDSALGGSQINSTSSISSSILKYRIENGRTYHAYKDGQYTLPNDEIENDRLDLQHHLFAMTFDGALGLCPLNSKEVEVNRVLDVGTGTGIWAIDYADDHPEAHVIGVDLSPTQPSFVPPNVSFEIDDLEEPWTYSQKFDYIHSRMMLGTFRNWQRFFEQCFENLEPGGYLEMQDTTYPTLSDDGTQKPDSALSRWAGFMLEAASKLGISLDLAPKYKDMMEAAGFVNVTVNLLKWPQNPWPKDKKLKEMGLWCRENILQGVDGFSLALYTRGLGWSKEEVNVHLVDVRKDIKDPKIHSYWAIWVVYGQKPKTASEA